MTDTANLRFRLSRGDMLCLNEHTVNRNDDHEFWMTCGDETIERWTFPADASSDEVQTWMMRVAEHHRRVVAERIVSELLDQLDEEGGSR